MSGRESGRETRGETRENQKRESVQVIENAQERELPRKVKVTIVLSREVVEKLREYYGNRGISVVIDSLLRALLLNQKLVDFTGLTRTRIPAQCSDNEHTYTTYTEESKSLRMAKRIICSVIKDGYEIAISKNRLSEYIQKLAGGDPRTVDRYLKFLEIMEYIVKENERVYSITHKAHLECAEGA